MFLALALLFVRSFWTTAAMDPGFDASRLLVIELDPHTYGYDTPRSRLFGEALRDRMAALPGAQHVALASLAPFYVGFPRTALVSRIDADCAATQCPQVVTYPIGAGHFRAIGAPLVDGRDFTPAEASSGDVVIVNKNLAERLWPGASPVGQRLRLGKDGHSVSVVGVAADVKCRSPAEVPAPLVYRPMELAAFAESFVIVVRAAGDPRSMLGAAQAQLTALDPRLPARSVKTMAQRMEMPLWPGRTAAGFFAICGSIALILSAIGLFGVTYYTVGQRTREFGVRAALGATRGAVIGLVLKEGLVVTAGGVTMGLGAALAAGGLMSSALVGIAPADPSSLALAASIQVCMALAACAWPAYRATRVDPLTALRQD